MRAGVISQSANRSRIAPSVLEIEDCGMGAPTVQLGSWGQRPRTGNNSRAANGRSGLLSGSSRILPARPDTAAAVWLAHGAPKKPK